MTKTETKMEETAQRKAPIIATGDCKWQSEGFAYREAFVRMPDGLVAQDLQDYPEIWKAVQGSRLTALRRFDRVTAIAFDESWVIRDAMVVEASGSKVKLHFDTRSLIKIETSTETWEDENHIVEWMDKGFGYKRKSDGVVMTAKRFETMGAARHDLHLTQYPQRAA